MLDLESLDAFVVFAEHLNFTHAAEALYISQPALHARIKKFSEGLGVVLYRRVGRKLELTQSGREVLRFGREMRERSESFVEELKMGESHRPVVLVAGAGSYLYLLGDAIRAYVGEEEAPLRLMTRDREGSIEAVMLGEAHLGVAPLESLVGSVESVLLAKVPQVLVCPRGHHLGSKREIALEDLEGERLVVPPPERPHRVALTRALLSAGVQWEVAVEANGWELMLHFASLGLGLTVVNGCCRLPEGLMAIPIPALPAVHYYVFHRKGLPLKGPAASLKALLLKDLSQRWGTLV